VDTFLHFGLCNALLATLLALALTVARPLVRRRPALAHGLWLLVLVKLVTPALVPLPVPWPASSEPGPAAAALPQVVEPPPSHLVDAAPAGPLAPLLPAGPEAEVLLPVVQDAPAAAAGWRWQDALAGTWLAGALAWWALAGWRLRRFQGLLRLATPAPTAVQEQARRLARRLGLSRCPEVSLVSVAVSPMLWALGWRPRLLLPADLWQSLNEEQQQALLTHELAHLRRRDHWARRLELLVRGLYWWLPVVWWAGRQLREAEEHCCDAWVVWALPGGAPAYAAALIDTVAFLGRARAALPVGASGIGHALTLKRRLTMILKATPPRSLSAPGVLVLAGLGALVLPLWPSWASTSAVQEQTAAPAKTTNPASTAGPGQGIAVADLDDEGPIKPVTPPQQALKPPPRLPVSAGTVQQLRDDIELLEVQVQIKHAEVTAAQLKLAEVQRKLKRLEELMRRGVIDKELVEEARAQAAAAQAQVRVKEAELREPEVRLRQARGRLQRLPVGAVPPLPKASTAPIILRFDELSHKWGPVQRGTVLIRNVGIENMTKVPVDITAVRTSAGCVAASVEQSHLQRGQKTFLKIKLDTGRFIGVKAFTVAVQYTGPYDYSGPGAHETYLHLYAASKDGGQAGADTGVADPKRLQKLEQKLDALQKQIDELRQGLRRQSSAATEPGQDYLVLHQRTFEIPYNVRQDVTDARSAALYVSEDRGKTWRLAMKGPPGLRRFVFHAPSDGVYWFSVSVEDAGGKNHPPADAGHFQPALKVIVDTTEHPAPPRIRGKIEKVDPANPVHVEINVGSDAGLAVNNKLEVFRLTPEPTFLGTIRIVSTARQRAIGRLESAGPRRPVPLRPGDEVASRLQAGR
jgi:beta-lactamase regulating signal transducer with metallopeptidase domain